MRPDEVRDYLKQRPFQPFRIHLSSGAFFDIRQPELVAVSPSALSIGLPVEGERQRFAIVALVHIVWLEVLVPVP